MPALPMTVPMAGMTPTVPDALGQSLWLASPMLLIFAVGLGLLLYDAIARPENKKILWIGSLAAVLASLGLTLATAQSLAVSGFNGMVVFDGFTTFFNVVLLVSAGLALLISPDYLERVDIKIGEYYPLALFALFGTMILAASNDLMMLFIAIEVMSIAFYVLTGIRRQDDRAVESAFKYFILGAFSSGILLYGISFVFGATGTTSLPAISEAIAHGASGGLLLVGVGFLLVGFGFKVSAAPFHMWTPDVYQGAPSTVTGYMATAVKAAAFAAFMRVLFVALPGLKDDWTIPLWVLAALTMMLGNVAALVQDDLKRMLAYSSIAHAGYILMALVAGESGNAQLSGILFYLLAYTFMNLGAFAVLTLMTGPDGDQTDVNGLRGLASRRPMYALGLTICLLSLAGIPPTMGFVGKFYLFAAAVNGGFYVLATIGAVSTAVGVYYYLRPIVLMYMREGEGVELGTGSAASAALALSCAILLLFGLLPSAVIEQCRAALVGIV